MVRDLCFTMLTAILKFGPKCAIFDAVIHQTWERQFPQARLAVVKAHYCIFYNILVEGGQRAIIFSRIGGIQNDIYSEGLHFR